ncbi:aminotransferase class III-fold pyridoxal phosphate-dependent enzyme [Leucobacter iarius]|uniref:4-aminobutyrate--2-oxoglutarate transaminase n=1 Tax=Leucobacter iarius TaxID=333963 RepID=A0ABN2LPI2_9MICO
MTRTDSQPTRSDSDRAARLAPPPPLGLDLPQSRSLTTEIPGPRSRALHDLRREHVADGLGVALPVFVERADGAIIQDVDGNRIIDLASGIGPTALGASNTRVRERMAAQLDRFTHACFVATEYRSFVEVCAWLNARTPGEFEKRTALYSTGAEANENAVKIARYATGRRNVLAFDGSFHGRTSLTMAMSSKVEPYKRGFGPFSDEVIHAPIPDPLRDGADGLASGLAAVRDALATRGPETFAAIIIEPIQGEAGCRIPIPGFLAGLREIADEHGILLIADEVQTGMGRTGRIFAIEHDGVAPDFVVSAKALANGMPLAAVTGRAEVMNAVHRGGLGGTYAGNPLACEAALAVFEQLEDGALLDRADRIGALAVETLRPLLLDPSVPGAPGIIDLRARGAMIGIEFGDPITLAPRPDLAAAVSKFCHANGVLTLTNGVDENVIRLLPPIVIEEALLLDALGVVRAGLEHALGA